MKDYKEIDERLRAEIKRRLQHIQEEHDRFIIPDSHCEADIIYVIIDIVHSEIERAEKEKIEKIKLIIGGLEEDIEEGAIESSSSMASAQGKLDILNLLRQALAEMEEKSQ
jgi:hypothetical protein